MPTTLDLVSSDVDDCVADVVFVHGISGDGYKTWQPKGVDGTWMHWIAKGHPKWAIWTLDYTADITNWQAPGLLKKLTRRGPGMAISELATSASEVLRNHDIGDRPIVFVCHSLGGLVIKQLLRASATQGFSDYRKLGDMTRGVAFLATPHTGSALASAAKRLPGLAKTTRTLLEMEEHSPHLGELKDWYRQNAPELGITTGAFTETRPLSGTTVIVNKSSADPNVPNVKTVPVDADHSTIAKPSSTTDQVYMSIVRLIKDALRRPATGTPLPSGSAGGLTRMTATTAPDENDWVVFVSYSNDDAHYLPKLDVHLTPLLPEGVRLWSDPHIRGGEQWEQAIANAIGRSLLAVILVSPELVASEFVIERELPALVETGVPIAPIHLRPTPAWRTVPALRQTQWAHDVDRDGPVTIKNGRQASEPEFDQAMGSAVTRIAERINQEYARRNIDAGLAPTIRSLPDSETLRPGSMGDLRGVPALIEGYVERTEDHARLRNMLLGTRPSTGLTGDVSSLGFHGQGGIGKTALAIALAHDGEIRTKFPDGVYWVALGEKPNLAVKQQDLLRLLEADTSVANSVEARRRLEEEFEGRQCLLVVDDVWSVRDAVGFTVTGPKGRTLFTTRDRRVLDEVGAQIGQVDVLEGEQAWRVLERASHWSGESRPDAVERLISATGGVALALALVGASLRDQPASAWSQAAVALEGDDATWLHLPYADVFKAMSLATSALEPREKDQLLSLAVYPEDELIPLRAIERFWSHYNSSNADHTKDLLDGFAERELVEFDGDAVRLHDLKRDFLRLRAPKLVLLHGELIEAYRLLATRWSQLPQDEPYIWDNLISHLTASGFYDEIAALGRDLSWILRRLRTDGQIKLSADLAAVRAIDPDNEADRVVDGNAHLLTNAPSEAAGAASIMARVPASLNLDASGLTALTPHGYLVPRWDPSDTDAHQQTVLEGHSDSVVSVAWSPDGTRLATASHDRTVRIWDAATGNQQLSLGGHNNWVRSVAWSPDGTRLATASRDETARIWDAATGKQLSSLKGYGSESVAWSPDGTRLATGGSERGRLANAPDPGTARIWDAATGTQQASLEGHSQIVVSVAWSPDGTQLATASHDGTARIWDAATGKQLSSLEGNNREVHSVAWSPDGTRLATGGWEHSRYTGGVGTARIWDAATGTQQASLEGHDSWVRSVAWSPDGSRVATASHDGTARIWDAATGTQQASLEGHSQYVVSVAWSPDGTRLATTSRDGTARIWDAATGTQQSLLEGHNDDVAWVAWSPDGTRLATTSRVPAMSSRDPTTLFWDAATGKLLSPFAGHSDDVASVAWSPDGTRLATTSRDRTVHIRDAATGSEMSSLYSFGGHASSALSVAWSPDGTRLATTTGNKTAIIWDAATRTDQSIVGHHTGWVESVAWSPDGTRLATTGSNGTTRIWDAATGNHQSTLQGHTDVVVSAAWSPDGTRLATTSRDRTARIWDAAGIDAGWRKITFLRRVFRSRLRARIDDHSQEVSGVSYSPDGTLIVTVSADETVRILDAKTAEQLITTRIGHPIRAVAWTDHGLALAYGKTFMVYDLWLGPETDI